MKEMLAVILAGGLGTRVRHLLVDLPKPLASAAGRPFLEWLLRYLRNQGVERAVLSAGHHAGKLEAFAARVAIPGMSVSCVRESEPLGTAGGFLHAVRESGNAKSDLLVCNGDSLVLTDLAPLLAPLSKPGTDASILGLQVAEAGRFGTLKVGNDRRLLGFEEKRPGPGTINGGVYVFRRSALARFPEKTPLSFEYDVFPSLLASGARIAAVPCDAPFLDIGTEESFARATDFIHNNMRWFE